MLKKIFQKPSMWAKTFHIRLGKDGEDLAVKYLKKKGYRILERNWRSHPYELDIICQHKDEIIFVEVKSRSSSNPEDAFNAFHNEKQKNVINAARNYLSATNTWNKPCRFDLICIYDENKNVEHFENVIELQDNRNTSKNRNTAHSGDSTWQPW